MDVVILVLYRYSINLRYLIKNIFIVKKLNYGLSFNLF